VDSVSLSIEKQINLSLTRLGMAIFEASQDKVPVCTGRLKRNALIRLNRNVVEIRYNTPYASHVEFGGAEYNGSLTYTSKTSPHTRVTVTGKRVNVRGHTKTYIGHKPIKCADGRWVVIDTSKPRAGKFYLSNAIKEVLNKALGKPNGLQAYIS